MCQMLEVWPMQKLKEQGWVNTRERKILFYTVRVLFHTIGFIGGVMMANMSIRLLVELVQLITPGFVIVSALIAGISVALYEYKTK
jgi:NhaP-type Na+/H+ or K+/H+ antiporter